MWEIKKQSVHYRILRSHKDTLHGRSDGIFPRTKKQSTGLFFARCGAPSCSNPRPSGNKKDPQPKLEGLLVPNQARYQLRYTPERKTAAARLLRCGWG